MLIVGTFAVSSDDLPFFCTTFILYILLRLSHSYSVSCNRKLYLLILSATLNFVTFKKLEYILGQIGLQSAEATFVHSHR